MHVPSHRLLHWQSLTLALMVLGYGGYYLCRSDFSVALPLLMDYLAAHGISPGDARIRLGGIASLGVLAYAIGKFFSGGLADFLGGRRNFLAGMAGSVLATAVFALGGSLPIFTVAWIVNRAVQSMGWVGMVKVTGRWFGFSRYGTVMGILSLSYLAGDAASRQFLGALIARGFGWQGLFLTSAGILALLFLLNFLFLKETPRQIGEDESPASPLNVFGEAGEKPAPASLGSLLAPLARSRQLWLICLISLALTLMRETFNTWTPTYFAEALGLSKAEAASKSALFPLFGAVSVLLAGFMSDRLGRAGRAAMLFGGVLLTGAALLSLGAVSAASDKATPVALVSVIGFLMIGPYSYLAGAIALDFGGKQGSATACGIIDGVGYLGGVLAGDSMARISLAYGWRGAFDFLAGVAALSSGAAAVYWLGQRRCVAATVALSAEAHRG